MCDINVTVVLLNKDVLSDLVSVDEGSVDLKGKHEFFKLFLYLCFWLLGSVVVAGKHADCILGPGIHCYYDFVELLWTEDQSISKVVERKRDLERVFAFSCKVAWQCWGSPGRCRRGDTRQ